MRRTCRLRAACRLARPRTADGTQGLADRCALELPRDRPQAVVERILERETIELLMGTSPHPV